MVTARRHSRIEDALPKEVRETVERMLQEGIIYEEVSDWLKSQGYDISRSSVGRYGKRYFELCQQFKRFEDMSKSLASRSEDGLAMEEVVGKMLFQGVMERLLEDDLDVTEKAKLMSSVARMQNSHVRMAKWKRSNEDRIRDAAKGVDAIVKKGGLSDEAAEEIRSKILGINR